MIPHIFFFFFFWNKWKKCSGINWVLDITHQNIQAKAGASERLEYCLNVVFLSSPQSLCGHKSSVRSLSFSSSSMMCSGSVSGEIRVWSVPNATCVGCFQAHSGATDILTFLDGGRMLLSASADHTVRARSLHANPGRDHLKVFFHMLGSFVLFPLHDFSVIQFKIAAAWCTKHCISFASFSTVAFFPFQKMSSVLFLK